MLKLVLLHLCGNDTKKLAAFVDAFPTAASFRPALEAFGDYRTLAGFLGTRYGGSFAKLAADLKDVGVETLKLMVGGTGKRRDQVGQALEKARGELDERLPPVGVGESEALVDARAKRKAIDDLWNALPEFPSDPQLRAVVVAIKAAQEAVENYARAVPEGGEVDPGWKEACKERRERLNGLRVAIQTVRGVAPDRDYGPIAVALSKAVEAVKQAEVGGVDEPYLEHVDGLLDQVDILVRGERVGALLEGPFDDLGDGLPDAYAGDLQALKNTPENVTDKRFGELEAQLPSIVSAYLYVEEHGDSILARGRKVLTRRDVKGFDAQLDHVERLRDQKDWKEAKKYLEKTVLPKVEKHEGELAKQNQQLQAELLAAQLWETQENNAIAWGETQFNANPLLKRVWAATQKYRKQHQENASISGHHSWSDVMAAIAIWENAYAGDGVIVTNVHVPGSEPEAKWEKDDSRKVAQANFICTWRKITVDIHVTVEPRSFLKNSKRWKRNLLPDVLEPYAPDPI